MQAQSKMLDFQMTYHKNLPEIILTDNLRLIQVLSNLLGNAIKFTNKGTVGISVKLVSAGKGFCEILFKVYDSGCGFDDINLDIMFNPFSQENEKVISKYGGHGLGLSIVNSIVKAMEGTIEAKSIIGKGSEFKIKIKFLIPGFKSEIKNTKVGIENISVDPAIYQTPYKILLADDSSDTQSLVKAFTKVTPLKLTYVNDGKKAFEMFKKNKYDLVILDLQMPFMNGRECIKKIREYEVEKKLKKTPSIAFTANGYQSDIDTCYKIGFDNFILKPAQKNTFLRKIYNTIFLKKER